MEIISVFLVCSVLLWFINRLEVVYIIRLEEPDTDHPSKPGFCVIHRITQKDRPLPRPPCPYPNPALAWASPFELPDSLPFSPCCWTEAWAGVTGVISKALSFEVVPVRADTFGTSAKIQQTRRK